MCQVNSTENRAALGVPHEGYGGKTEFDIYVEKLLDLKHDFSGGKNEGDVGAKGKECGAHHHEIEENLSAFLNNISLTDIPEIEEGDEEALAGGDKAIPDIPASINFL